MGGRIHIGPPVAYRTGGNATFFGSPDRLMSQLVYKTRDVVVRFGLTSLQSQRYRVHVVLGEVARGCDSDEGSRDGGKDTRRRGRLVSDKGVLRGSGAELARADRDVLSAARTRGATASRGIVYFTWRGAATAESTGTLKWGASEGASAEAEGAAVKSRACEQGDAR